MSVVVVLGVEAEAEADGEVVFNEAKKVGIMGMSGLALPSACLSGWLSG